jgi:hypothetical protein
LTVIGLEICANVCKRCRKSRCLYAGIEPVGKDVVNI